MKYHRHRDELPFIILSLIVSHMFKTRTLVYRIKQAHVPLESYLPTARYSNKSYAIALKLGHTQYHYAQLIVSTDTNEDHLILFSLYFLFYFYFYCCFKVNHKIKKEVY